MDMDNTPELAVWEKELLGLEVTPEDEERQERRAREAREQADAAHAARIAAWPALYNLADGATVDLNDLWYRVDTTDVDDHALGLVQALAEQAGGAAKRLAAGCQSLLDRRDGNVEVVITRCAETAGVIDIVAWSYGGCWRPERTWRLRTSIMVSIDQWDEVRLESFWGAELAVHGRGGTTVFKDDEGGALARVAIRWYYNWEARRAIRTRLAEDLITPPSLEAFLVDPLGRQAPQKDED